MKSDSYFIASFATRLVETDGFTPQARIQLKTAQELLSHSTIATTADIYSHVSSEMREEVVNKMDNFFKRS